MDLPQSYIIIAIIILAIIASFVFIFNKRKEKPAKLAWLSLAFIFAGIFFSGLQTTGYSLMGIGGILAIIDISKRHYKNDARKIIISIGSAIALAIALVWLYAYKNEINLKNKNINLNFACTQEVKICPEGTAVGRSGPSCEFNACPLLKIAPVTEEIQKLFVAKYPKYAETVIIDVAQETQDYARGSVSFETGASGGIFLAIKIDGQWQIVFDGNSQIPCDLSRYGFPSNMLMDCF